MHQLIIKTHFGPLFVKKHMSKIFPEKIFLSQL